MAESSSDNVTKLGQDIIWLKTNADIKKEASSVREKLHHVREKYRSAYTKPGNIKDTNTSMIQWNEDLLAFCKANRRKYKMEDRTLKLDRQRMQDQMIIAQYEEEKEKLQKELKEATEAKERALNRLSELQSHMLKLGNPEITDLSDQNRPTNLGENFRELYDNEWTDAFEFLTAEDGICRKDEEAIAMLYSMLKCCSELCSEVLRRQHTALAELVSSPPYLKPNAAFAKTAPAKQPSTGVQAPGPQVQSQTCVGSKGSSGNKNTQQQVAKPEQLTDVYEVKQAPVETKPNTEGQAISTKVDVPIKEFSKSVAVEVLKKLSTPFQDILQAINEQKKFQEDVLQNGGIQKYLEKCFSLCWLMQTQYPPMLMDFETKPGTFDTHLFETYTTRGPTIAYIVWPPVYLHENGPLVCKGYAEGNK